MDYTDGSIEIIQGLRWLGSWSISGVVLLIFICWSVLLLARRLIRVFFLVLFLLGSGSAVAELRMKVSQAVLGVG
jgi:CHASE2 domain-containing sensor protein